ncbi:TFIIH complex serine/threonine-protein kinase subunit kin28 [Borealophlyctis nickersoniae]|nr:TFIIH complex serine/threonine-protein kinase subunit kin28 [Borealophlyctis nickersoniae]
MFDKSLLGLPSNNPLYSHYTKDKKIGEGTYAVVYQGWAIPRGQPEEEPDVDSPPSDQPTPEAKENTKNVTESEQSGEPLKKAEKAPPRRIAIKKIKIGQFKDGLDMSAIREVKFLREMDHPNIIQLIDVFSHKTNLNLVLEFLDADLEMIMKNKAVLFTGADVKSWMLMAFRGLYHCHRSFILHRDLKPNNLLLASDGQLKLADFGLARDYGNDKRVMTSQVVTRWYRAPELLLGAQSYGYGVDIWAMGCIFAELFWRSAFLPSDTDIGQLQAIFNALGTPTEEEWPGMKSLPGYHDFKFYPKIPLKQHFKAATDDALDLLGNCFVYDPLKRITALDALNHFYFKNQPRPTPPEKLPRAGGHHVQHVELPSDVFVAGMKRKSGPAEEGDERKPKVARKLFV